MPRLMSSAIAALLLALTAYPAASAEPGAQVMSVKVAYGDLDLSRSGGAETLLGRIRVASLKVCGAKPSPRQLQAIVRRKACVKNAMSVGVANIDAPLVTALFHGEGGPKAVALR